MTAVKAPPIRVLYMEDDHALIALVGRRLKGAGYEVEAVYNGTSGWQRLLERTCDIAVLDNDMPGLTGLEIVRRANDQPEMPPLVMLTGAGSESLAVEAMREGASNYVVKDVNGAFIEMLPIIIRQVLQERQHKREGQQAEIAYQAEMQRRELLARFIRDASHEFRTPLTVIGTSIYLLERSELNERQQRYVTSVQTQANSIEKLADNMIHLLRLDSITMLERAPYAIVSLVDLLRGVIASYCDATMPQPHIVNDTAPDASILVDPDELHLAFLKLIDNAVRYGDPAHPFSLTIRDDQEWIKFEIVDHGIGIPEEVGTRVFDRFFRVDDMHQTRGFGLGLPIARRIIELHNGTIALSSLEGQGTTVTIALPAG
ncbi:MAG: ATP-binding protein [Chloroflexota bacterium]|nr:ATP-binding protein [Chloroflexota bacterium]